MITAYLTNADDGTPASEPDKDTLQAMGEAISRRMGGSGNPASCLQTYTNESSMNPPTAQVVFMMQFSNPHKAFTEHQNQRFDGTEMKQGSLIMHRHTGQQYRKREYYPPANRPVRTPPSSKPPTPNQHRDAPTQHCSAPCTSQGYDHTGQQYTNGEYYPPANRPVCMPPSSRPPTTNQACQETHWDEHWMIRFWMPSWHGGCWGFRW